MNYYQNQIYNTFKNQIYSDLAIKWFFSEYDVYYSDDCSYKFLSKDSGFVSRKNMRKAWVFGNSGYINQIEKYYNFYDRLFEFITVKDNPNTLRQKINILHFNPNFFAAILNIFPA